MSAEARSAVVVKVKPTTTQDVHSKGKFDSTSGLKKKIESSNQQQPRDSKNKSDLKPANAKTTTSSAKTTAQTKTVTPTKPAKREKKVFNLPGQKYDPPEEREPLRIFYESLSKQIPSSEMAEFWLMEHGLLSPERSKKAYEKKQRKQKGITTKPPTRTPPPPTRPESSLKQHQATKNGENRFKKRPADDSDDEHIAIARRRKG